MLKKDYVEKLVADLKKVSLAFPDAQADISGNSEGTMPIRVSTARHPEALLFFADAAYRRFSSGKESYDQSVQWFKDKVVDVLSSET